MQKMYLFSEDGFGFVDPEEAVLISPGSVIPSDIQESTVIIDWDSRQLFRNSYHILRDASKILFKFGDTLVDMSDDEKIENEKIRALAKQNYTRCKTINRALIEYSVIKRLENTNCMPAELQLETTDICNAKCIMCSHFYRQGSHTITKSKDIVGALRGVLPFLETIYLHGNGEPFLDEGIDEFAAQIHSYGIRCMANTNLSVLTDDNIRTIGNCFSEINISIDGADAKTYESIRRGLSFDVLVKNCKRLRKSCSNLYIRMWAVMMSQNIDYLSELVKFAAELEFDEIVFTELSSDERLKNKEDMASCYPHTVSMELNKARETAEQYGIKLIVPEYAVSFNPEAYKEECKRKDYQSRIRNEDYYKKLFNEIHNSTADCIKRITKIGEQKIPCLHDVSVSGICDWAVERPFIDLDGNVSVCCINQHFILGNLFEHPFEEIWQGRSAANFRRCFYKGQLPYFCSGCEFLMQNRLLLLEKPDNSVCLRSKMHFGDMI